MPTIIPPLSLNAQGDQVKTVQANLAKVGLTVPPTETAASTLGAGTAATIKQFQAASNLPVTGSVDTVTGAMLANTAALAGTSQSSINGRLTMDYGGAAIGITARLYSIAYGGRAAKLAEGKTDAHGVYSLAYTHPAAGVNVEVRVADAQGKETTISSIIYKAPAQLVLNLVVPATVQPLTAEYQRLAADVQSLIGGTGIANLATAQETDNQQDLTLLNHSTGWDARLLALAANAAKLTATTGLGQDILYALLRTGLPTDPQMLALIPSATIATALTKANQAGIVSLTATQITAAQTAFITYAAKTNLATKATGAPSAFSDLLGSVLKDAGQQSTFAGLFFDPTIASADLWSKSAAAGISVDAIATLKQQGKLALLTLNNAGLIQKLQTTLGTTNDLAILADNDFHLPATWSNTINAIAGKDPQKLQLLIPSTYGGATATDQLAAYSADLARKVRVNFPTRVVARMAISGAFALDSTLSTKAGAFLQAADKAGYQLGRTPLNQFLKKLPTSVPAPDAPTIATVKRLHRLYQITPSNESLQSALKLGFTSARDIIAYTQEKFLTRFGSSFPSLVEANMVYQKAQQVASVTLNLFAAVKHLIQPPVFAMASSASDRTSARNAITQQFPGMSSLFGSLDFCECEECRSVLSPAAYLVDILHFLDPDPNDWQSTIANWQNDHNGQIYPFMLQNAPGTPFQALTLRRPDLPNLNLSCKNTNTALPYIDVVNEILEYFVAHNALSSTAVYDTGSANSADLIAEPQNVLPAAYAVLSNSSTATIYPMGLPFDLWIETVRGFLNYFKMPLWQIAETFRPVDPMPLFGNPGSYSQSAIFSESLGLSPTEYNFYTQNASLSNWFKLYGYTNANDAAALSSAKTLADSLDITYQNLADIMETGFLNPALVPLTTSLQKFGLSLSDIFSYTPTVPPAQPNAFEQKLQCLMQQYYPQFPVTALQKWLATVATAGLSNTLLVLQAPPQNTCDFHNTTFIYAGGNAAQPLDFLKLNLFVRLWKKLGWSIDELDWALQVFLAPLIPAASDANFNADFSNAMVTALLYLSHLQTLYDRLPAAPFSRIGMLPLWTGTDIPTTGINPMYAQIFLTAAVLNNDPIFDDPAGHYLSYFDSIQNKYLPFRWQAGQTAEDLTNGYVLLENHLTAVQGALGLAADEVAAILGDQSLDISSMPLTLSNLSLLYRYALLSSGLQLSIADFIALRNMAVDKSSQAALNPFTSIKSGSLAVSTAVLSDDVPWSQTLKFIEMAELVQQSGFAVQDLQYLLRHQIADPASKYQSDPANLLQQIRALSVVLLSIQSANAVPADPTSFTDDVIRQKMGQVYPATVTQTFMGMWSGTIQYQVTPISVTGPMPAEVFAQDSEIKLAYDPITQSLSLTFYGVPLASRLSALSAELTALVTTTTITAAQQTQLQGMLDDVHGQALTFFQTYLQQSTVGGQKSGFLQAADFETLFTMPAGQASARTVLAQEFLPWLQNQLMDQAIFQALVAQLASNASLTKTLLTNTAILSDPTTTPVTPLVEAFKSAADQGVTASYFSDSAEQNLVRVDKLPTANTDSITNPYKPSGVNSVHFEGYLEVPVDGPYSFTAILPNATATVTLQFDLLSTPLMLNTVESGNTSPSKYTLLKAGIPCHFTLDFQGLAGGDAKLLVQGETLPLGPLSQLLLYPEASVQRYNRARILLAKTLQLIQGFSLDEREVVYIATNAGDFGNLNFNALPTQASDDSTPKAQALFGQFLRLANYAALKAGPAGGTDGLINVFQNARQTIPVSPLPILLPPGVTTAQQLVAYNFYQAIANVTRRDAATIQAVIVQLWGTGAVQTTTTSGQVQFTVASLVNDLGFARLWEALKMVQTLQVQPQVLTQTTGIIYPSRATAPANPDTGVAIAATLRNAVKSQYTSDQWQPLAQSVFDPLRQKKRDALCAKILTMTAIVNFGATDTNGLFEYFLVDPGMEPVVQTSRIRLALSSVQTFIQRCFLNLEPQVKPSVMDSGKWDWMKRYRVWEANREIFLWPENWLIPEFRENATDLFQAMQGTLLQGDITQDLVEKVFTQYLQDLDTRARLDIVSMFNQAPAPGTAATANTLHVIGRHHGKPSKYFYRTYSNGIWNAWIPVSTDIEGDHVVAVIWRGRLNLFWLTFVVQGTSSSASSSTQSNSDGTSGSNNLTQLSFNDLSNILVTTGAPQKTVQVQLNWSEYYQAKWTPRKSSDIKRFIPIFVDTDFDPAKEVYPHVSIDTDNNGNETAVRIHMDGINQAFRLTGKNSEPVCSAKSWVQRRYTPYGSYGYDATRDVGYIADPASIAKGSGLLQATYLSEITELGGNLQSINVAPKTILQTVNSFNLLVCDNLPQPSGQGAAWTDYVYSYYLSQVGTLSSPFFFEDTSDPNASQELTFFVQPTITESSFSRWEGWALHPSFPPLSVINPNYWNILLLTPQIPFFVSPNPPDPAAIFQYQPNVDTMVNAATQISYDNTVFGIAGKISASTTMAGNTTGAAAQLISKAGMNYVTALSYSLTTKNQIAASQAAAQ